MAEAVLAHDICDAAETRAQIADPRPSPGCTPAHARRRPPVHPLQPDARQVRTRNPAVSCVGSQPQAMSTRTRTGTAAGPGNVRRRRWRSAGETAAANVVIARAGERHHAGSAYRGDRRPWRGRLVAWCGGGGAAARGRSSPASEHAEPIGDEVVRAVHGLDRRTTVLHGRRRAAVLDVGDRRAGEAKPALPGRRGRDRPDRRPDRRRAGGGARHRAVLVTADNVAGNEPEPYGRPAPANVRLPQRGVRIERRTLPSRTAGAGLELWRWRTASPVGGGCCRVAAVVDCGFRLPAEPSPGAPTRGDCVAPRTILEAVLEGGARSPSTSSTSTEQALAAEERAEQCDPEQVVRERDRHHRDDPDGTTRRVHPDGAQPSTEQCHRGRRRRPSSPRAERTPSRGARSVCPAASGCRRAPPCAGCRRRPGCGARRRPSTTSPLRALAIPANTYAVAVSSAAIPSPARPKRAGQRAAAGRRDEADDEQVHRRQVLGVQHLTPGQPVRRRAGTARRTPGRRRGTASPPRTPRRARSPASAAVNASSASGPASTTTARPARTGAQAAGRREGSPGSARSGSRGRTRRRGSAAREPLGWRSSSHRSSAHQRTTG